MKLGFLVALLSMLYSCIYVWRAVLFVFPAMLSFYG
jgi:hypothetical protein